MSQQRQPPRPQGVGRPGSGDHPKPPLERSESPSPEAQRIPAIPARVIEAQAEPHATDPRRDPIRLPSPRADRRHVRTETAWPLSDGYLPGMPESMPPPRGRLESHQHLHVILEREARERDDSMAPKSARQRAGDALKGARQPLLVTLISTLLSGGSVTAILATREPTQAERPATSVDAGVKLKENQRNLAADLAANDRGDRAHEKWDIEEHRKFDERLRELERKLRRMPAESLEPEAPPAAPPPPRKPDLPEKVGQ